MPVAPPTRRIATRTTRIMLPPRATLLELRSTARRTAASAGACAIAGACASTREPAVLESALPPDAVIACHAPLFAPLSAPQRIQCPALLNRAREAVGDSRDFAGLAQA